MLTKVILVLLAIASVVTTTLKLANVIKWSWWIVLMPAYPIGVYALCVFIVMLAIMFLFGGSNM